MRSIWCVFAGVGLVALAGCSHLPGRTPLPKLGLPSPEATIEATERDKPAGRPPSTRVAPAGRQPAGSRGDAAVSAALHRGRALEQAGQLDRARKTYESALSEQPGSAPLLHRLGIVADRQKKHAEAANFFLQALKRSPQDSALLGDLGYCYFLQGKLDEAQEMLAEAAALDPKCARHHNNLGLVLGHQGNYDAAFEQFSAAGSEADAFYNMAFVFASQEMTGEAKGCFQEALAVDPSHERAQEALASFEAYERSPDDDSDVDLAGGIRYVPYVEEPEATGSDAPVRQASATTPLPASRDVGHATRALQLKSRGLLSRHMQQQRGTGLQPVDAQVENLPSD